MVAFSHILRHTAEHMVATPQVELPAHLGQFLQSVDISTLWSLHNNHGRADVTQSDSGIATIVRVLLWWPFPIFCGIRLARAHGFDSTSRTAGTPRTISPECRHPARMTPPPKRYTATRPLVMQRCVSQASPALRARSASHGIARTDPSFLRHMKSSFLMP